MKKLFFSLLIGLLLLTSCRRGFDPYNMNIYTGTKGVEIRFIDGSPPDEIYEGADFPVAVIASNEGAFSLNQTFSGIISYSYDKFYFEEIDNGIPDEQELMLLGKSYYYPSGEDNMFVLSSFKAKEILGQRERPDSTIYVSACYPYKTLLRDEVCIDFSIINPQDIREKVCTSETKTYAGQGAPVVVTEVKPEMKSYGPTLIRPAFRITVEDRGSGGVLSPYADNFPKSACYAGFQDDRSKWNTVRIKAKLSGDELVCNPPDIKLINNKGVTTCTLNNGGYGGALNYLSQLIVDLEYTYTTGISKKIYIDRTFVPAEPLEASKTCGEGLIFIGGRCVSECSTLGDGWGCNCRESECGEQAVLNEDSGDESIELKKSMCNLDIKCPEPISEEDLDVCCRKQ
ncbi:hypothetical protein ACFLTH_08950 [Bacteroidota bacterium]